MEIKEDLELLNRQLQLYIEDNRLLQIKYDQSQVHFIHDIFQMKVIIQT